MSNRSTYEASVLSAETTKAESRNTGQKSFQASIAAAIAAYNAGGSNATYVASIATANTALLEAYANAEKARQAAHAAARDTLRTAGGDSTAF